MTPDPKPEAGDEAASDVSLQSHGKQISLQLHADGARVTSVNLQGNRLTVTIEAELEPTSLAAAGFPVPKPEPKRESGPVHEPPALAEEPEARARRRTGRPCR